MEDRLLCAFPLGVYYQGDLGRRNPLPDETELHGLINEEFPDSMSFITQVRSTEGRICGGIPEFIAVLEERERRLFLERIFATGLHRTIIVVNGNLLENDTNPNVQGTPKRWRF